jgi:tRNA A-37 threonylcarbamoyl transferase component Bud32
VADVREDGVASGVPTQPRGNASTTVGSLHGSPGESHAAGTEIGRYRLRARLGAGAMGEVWVATDPQLERDVAIKLVHPKLARHPDISARMVREARAMAKVSHRGVIAIHDAGEADGQLFLAMELVRGRTLGALLRERTNESRRDWRHWLAIAIDAGRGLAAAHAAGVLHRDFKPDNVMVDEHGRVCVGDFGLATLGTASQSPRTPDDNETSDAALTMAGALLGTPAYMSLEQLQGKPIDARADQFSFCVTTYEAVYGEAPFAVPPEERNNIGAIHVALASGAIRPPPPDARVPAELRAILIRGLTASPADRWPDLDTLLAALTGVLAPSRSRRAIVAGGVGVGLLAIAGVTWGLHRPHPAAQATSLGPIPLHAILALSPRGRLAIGTDRLEVRELASPQPARQLTPVPLAGHWVRGLQFDGDDVVRWSVSEVHGVSRWDLARGSAPIVEPNVSAGTWIASLDSGDLVQRDATTTTTTLALVHGDHTLRALPLDPGNEQVAVSPSRRRFAYGVGDRFSERLAVEDATGEHTWRSPPVADLSAFAWLDDHTLIYASKNSPTIEAIDVDGDAPPRTVHRMSVGFVGQLVANATTIIYKMIDPTTRVRLIGRNPTSVRELDPSVAAELGWTADGSYVIWHQSTHALERVAKDGARTPLAAQLEHEPANATFAGNLALVAERGVGGRELVALDVSTNRVAWHDPLGKSIAARCAHDLAPPCFVARRDDEAAERYEIVPIDPRSGAKIGAPVYRGALEDFAVSGDGHRILVAEGRSVLLELDDGGARLDTYDLAHDLLRIRSVAYDPLGGMLIAGSGSVGNYMLGHYDGTTFTVFDEAGDELLSLVRPSPVTDQVLAQGRTWSASLWQLAR